MTVERGADRASQQTTAGGDASRPRWDALALAPDAPALVFEGGAWSWRELHERTQARAKALGPGAPRLLHAPNTVELVVELLALQEAGRVPVLVNPRVPRPRAEALFARAGRALEGVAPAVRASLADVVFTSGSTGEPKAVAHDFACHRASAEGANDRVPFGPGDRWLLSLSLCHVGGLGVLERARLSGGALVVPPPAAPLAEALARFSITHVSLVRAQLQDLLDDEGGRGALARAKAALVGGGPCPREVFERALLAGAPVSQTWGLTESTAQVTTSEPSRPFTAGRPLLHREVRVTAAGRLALRGPGLARGYLTEEGLSLPLDDEGFFVTSDLGSLTSGGEVLVAGRADLMFISGGENIHPEEIEAALLSLPGVKEALVVPVEHPRWGQRPVAFVDLRGALDEAALRAHLGERLPRFLVPDAFFRWPEGEPRGKPSRPRLAALARSLHAVR